MLEPLEHKTLYYGDCLEWMGKFHPASVDLIYLDPPFNSNASYNMTFGEANGKPAQLRAFEDTWKWGAEAAERVERIKNSAGRPIDKAIKACEILLGNSGMLSYVSYMAERLYVMKQLLKPTGSLYLHCDPTAGHYLKIVLDCIFGGKNFRNEIAWCYTEQETATRYFPKKHDTIFLYSNSDNYTFNVQWLPHSASQLKRYNIVKDGKRYANMKGKIRELGPGSKVRDWWNINIAQQKERLGYDTQKPIELLKRIIQASSNKGDFVLDPFCGCGTTIAAAHALEREWAGIDISSLAVDIVTDRRLKPLNIVPYRKGIPADLSSAKRLATEKPLDFEAWAVQRIDGLVPNDKQTGDGGIDGRGKLDNPTSKTDKLQFNDVLAQVKGGNFSLSQLRDFLHVVESNNAAIGVYITLEKVTSNSAKAEVASFGKTQVGSRDYQRVVLWSIEDYFDDRRPDIPQLLDPYTGKRQAQQTDSPI